MRALLLSGLACVLIAAPAHAQDEASNRERARQQFELALELFDDEDYENALIAFEAAYEAMPNPRVLYNIGNVHAALGHSVEAVDAYEGYLAGVENIDADRRAQVEAALERHRRRVGRVTFEINVEGAMITMNGNDVGVAPLAEPLRVTLGSYTFGARARGYDEPSMEVDVPGGGELVVPLTLRPSTVERGVLRVRSVPEGVTVLVDGREVGVTPLDETVVVDPGEHTVVGRRRGYLDASYTANAVPDGEIGVRLELEIDRSAPAEDLGRLRVEVPGEITSLRVDGVDFVGSTVELPVGPHDVRLQVRDRDEVRRTVEVPSGGVALFAPELAFSQGALRDQSSGASLQQTVGWALTIGGALVLGASIGLFAWNWPQYEERQEVIDLFEGPGGCIPEGRACDLEHGVELDRRYQTRSSQEPNILITSVIGIVLGSALTTVGLVVALTAGGSPSNEPSARLRVGPGGLSLEGAF